jgi:hypothetical protein
MPDKALSCGSIGLLFAATLVCGCDCGANLAGRDARLDVPRPAEGRPPGPDASLSTPDSVPVVFPMDAGAADAAKDVQPGPDGPSGPRFVIDWDHTIATKTSDPMSDGVVFDGTLFGSLGTDFFYEFDLAGKLVSKTPLPLVGMGGWLGLARGTQSYAGLYNAKLINHLIVFKPSGPIDPAKSALLGEGEKFVVWDGAASRYLVYTRGYEDPDAPQVVTMRGFDENQKLLVGPTTVSLPNRLPPVTFDRQAWMGKALVSVGMLGKSPTGMGANVTIYASILMPPYTSISKVFDVLPPAYETIPTARGFPLASDGARLFMAYEAKGGRIRLTWFQTNGSIHSAPVLMPTTPLVAEPQPQSAVFHDGHYVLVGMNRYPSATVPGLFLAVWDNQLQPVIPAQVVPIPHPWGNFTNAHIFSHQGSLYIAYAGCTYSCPGDTDTHLMKLRLEGLP